MSSNYGNLVERMIRIKDKTSSQADRDTLSEACNALTGLTDDGTTAAVLSGQEARQAERHALALEQCSLFAADAGESIANAMNEAARFLRSLAEGNRE